MLEQALKEVSSEQRAKSPDEAGSSDGMLSGISVKNSPMTQEAHGFSRGQFTACFIAFILHHAGLLMHVSAGERSGVVKLPEIMKVDFPFPSLFLPEWLSDVTVYGIVAAAFVTGIAGCRTAQRVLERKTMRVLCSYSFSEILIFTCLYAGCFMSAVSVDGGCGIV